MPMNFSFVIPGKLAGMGRLPHGQSLKEELWSLTQQGIGAVVSLTLSSPDLKAFNETGIEHLHLPVMDFTPPSLEQVDRFVEFTDRMIAEGKAVVVHCGAGMGRTGTMLACYLVHIGEGADEAIESVRRIRPGSIETGEQEECVRQYARQDKDHRCSGPNHSLE